MSYDIDERLKALPGYYFTHIGMREDLKRFASIVKKLSTFSEASCKKLHSYFVLHMSCLHGHHGLEDAYFFPRIEQDYPELADQIHALEEDHHKLDAHLAMVEDCMQTAHSKKVQERYEQTIEDYAEFILDHLKREESLMATIMFDIEGGLDYILNLDKEMFQRTTLKEKRHLMQSLPWLASHMPENDRTAFFRSHTPFFVPWIYTFFLRPKFNKQLAVFQ